MFFLKYSTRFKKDLKSFKHSEELLLILEDVLDILISGKQLPEKYRNHQLQGEFNSCFECHLRPDVLLVYKKNFSVPEISGFQQCKKDKQEVSILLLRIGSHSDLF